MRSGSGTVADPCTRRRARLASCLAAARGAPQDGGDLIKRHGEQVVQHERQPLGGGQGFEHHQQRETDRVSQQGFVLGVGPVLATRNRVGHVRAQWFLAPRLARAEHVQADPPHDRRKPSAEVVYAVRVGPTEPQPGLLDDIVRLA